MNNPRPFSELRSTGLLWLFNTAVLHPRGFALAFHYAEDADPNIDEPIGWSIVGDGSEPWVFSDGVDPQFAAVEALLAGHRSESPTTDGGGS